MRRQFVECAPSPFLVSVVAAPAVAASVRGCLKFYPDHQSCVVLPLGGQFETLTQINLFGSSPYDGWVGQFPRRTPRSGSRQADIPLPMSPEHFHAARSFKAGLALLLAPSVPPLPHARIQIGVAVRVDRGNVRRADSSLPLRRRLGLPPTPLGFFRFDMKPHAKLFLFSSVGRTICI